MGGNSVHDAETLKIICEFQGCKLDAEARELRAEILELVLRKDAGGTVAGTAGDRIAFVTLPKAESAADVARFLHVLRSEALRCGVHRTIPVSVMIETHGAVREAWSIAALPGVVEYSKSRGACPSARAGDLVTCPAGAPSLSTRERGERHWADATGTDRAAAWTATAASGAGAGVQLLSAL